MSIETFLENQLRKFSILDFSLVKSVYFIISILIFSLYTPLAGIGWLFYAVLCLLCAVPLWVHLFSQEGALMDKMDSYLKTNGPANQVLLFLSVFFSAMMLCVLFPVISSFSWYTYCVIAILLAIKPLTVTKFW